MIVNVRCPDCQTDAGDNKEGIINIPVDSQAGDILECPECGAEVELISINPPLVSLLEEEK